MSGTGNHARLSANVSGSIVDPSSWNDGWIARHRDDSGSGTREAVCCSALTWSILARVAEGIEESSITPPNRISNVFRVLVATTTAA